MNIMRKFNFQKGVSLFGFFFWTALIGFMIFTAFRLEPPYYEYYKVKNTLNAIKESAQKNELVKDKGKDRADYRAAIKKRLNVQFAIDSIRNIHRDSIMLTNRPEGIEVTVSYEVRTHYLGNIDFVLNFEDSELIPIKYAS